MSTRRSQPPAQSAEPDPARAGRELLGALPDVRDGLTRLERIILYELREAERERPGRNVPTALLYGRVVEHIDVGIADFQAALTRLIGR